MIPKKPGCSGKQAYKREGRNIPAIWSARRGPGLEPNRDIPSYNCDRLGNREPDTLCHV